MHSRRTWADLRHILPANGSLRASFNSELAARGGKTAIRQKLMHHSARDLSSSASCLLTPDVVEAINDLPKPPSINFFPSNLWCR